jgi:hypothetical protein
MPCGLIIARGMQVVKRLLKKMIFANGQENIANIRENGFKYRRIVRKYSMI